ncbi:unnamed protein product [Tuber aestivum]|uniref:Uncharacterized protein n=1 Tax=Tuber aestivum TaxID=59557 RepID=A0A292Q4H9_9PEZI|nr:unnamed protein product [Tuber aestivum]
MMMRRKKVVAVVARRLAARTRSDGFLIWFESGYSRGVICPLPHCPYDSTEKWIKSQLPNLNSPPSRALDFRHLHTPSTYIQEEKNLRGTDNIIIIIRAICDALSSITSFPGSRTPPFEYLARRQPAHNILRNPTPNRPVYIHNSLSPLSLLTSFHPGYHGRHLPRTTIATGQTDFRTHRRKPIQITPHAVGHTNSGRIQQG